MKRTLSFLFRSFVLSVLVLESSVQAEDSPDLRKQVEELTRTVKTLQDKVDKQEKILKDHGISQDKHGAHATAAPSHGSALQEGARKGQKPGVFNPSLSSALDFVSSYTERNGADCAVRSAELMIDSNVDQWAYAYAILNAGTELALEERTGTFRRNAEGTRVNLEEAAIQTTSLPHGLGLKAGRFFADFTHMGKVHPHDRPFVDGPRSIESIIGGETQATGGEMSWIAPLNQSTRLTFGMVDGIGTEPPNTAALTLPDGNTRSAFDTTGYRSFDDLTYYVRGATIFEVAERMNLHFGANYATSMHDAKRQIASADLKLEYQPHPNRNDRFVWGSEALWQRQRGTLPVDSFIPSALAFSTIQDADAVGGYTYAQYRFGKYWEPGVRFDVTVPEGFEMRDIDGDGQNDFATTRDWFYTYSTYLSAYPSEFQRLRLQLSYVDVQDDSLRGGGNTRGIPSEAQVWLQWTVWLGEHHHEHTASHESVHDHKEH
jgi:hypothetical protein